MLIAFYYLIVIFYLLNFILQAAGQNKWGAVATGCGLTANTIALAILFNQAGHIPVYNIFESFLLMTFILGCISFFHNSSENRMGFWLSIEILVLICITFFFPRESAPSNYNYEFFYVISFHALRYISLALMLYSSAYFVEFIVKRERNERTRALLHQGRNFLLLSTVLFLLSEYVGIIWCQMGWGDFWMWGVTFFQSTFIVLYLMLAFHIPGKGKYSEDIKAIFGGLTGLVVLSLTVIRSFF
jgi:hypothetical protein